MTESTTRCPGCGSTACQWQRLECEAPVSSTMDPSMWRERAQRAEAEVERLAKVRDNALSAWHREVGERMEAQLRAETAEDRLRKVADELPAECWVSRTVEVRCIDFVGGALGSGTFTRDMACLPCRVRAALAAPPAAPEAAEKAGAVSRWLPSEDCSVCHGEDVQCSACRPAPVSSGEGPEAPSEQTTEGGCSEAATGEADDEAACGHREPDPTCGVCRHWMVEPDQCDECGVFHYPSDHPLPAPVVAPSAEGR